MLNITSKTESHQHETVFQNVNPKEKEKKDEKTKYCRSSSTDGCRYNVGHGRPETRFL